MLTPSSSPAATLVPVTKDAERALGGSRKVPVNVFPFKVGRENRSPNSINTNVIELRLGTEPDLNDLYLIEPPWSDLLQISREHFTIEYMDNQFFLVDRGSTCGTIVAGRSVGGNQAGGRTELQSGDEIVIGTDESPYVFRFEIVPG